MRTRYLLFLVLAVMGVSSLLAQSTGDYRSVATGNWSSASTWNTFDGANWIAASMAPDGTHRIIVQSADSVFIDVLVSISDTLKNQGKLGGTGSLTIANGGVYQHDEQNGSLPQCTWAAGSTCFVTGYVTGNKPNNGNQNFHNFEWNCPGQTSNVDLGMSGNTIHGNFTVVSTGSPTAARVYLTSPGSYTYGNPITIEGNVVMTGGQFASNGSGTPDTIEVITLGDITVTGGIFAISRGSAPEATWKLYGNFTVQNATLQNSGGTHVNTLEMVGTGVHNVVLENVAYGGGTSYFTMQVDSGSTMNLGTSVVTNANTGSIIVKPGATLICSDPGGINGNVQSLGERGGGNSFSTLANYVFNGSVAQVTGSYLPSPVNSLTIDNPVGVTLTDSCVVTETLHLTAGILVTGVNTLTANGTVVRGSGYVSGVLNKPFAGAGSKEFEVGTADGYSPVTVNVTAGSGDLSVAAVQGAHPHVVDAQKTIPRYWTLTANGITQADLAFHYLASDINGTESAYKVGRYEGSTFAVLPTTIDQTNHIASVSGVTSFSDWTIGEELALPVKDAKNGIPSVFYVDPVYPNPFNPSASIRFGLPVAAWVSVKVYNIVGQEVAELYEGMKEPGVHTVQFDGANLGSGIYLCRIAAGTFVDVQRLVLAK